MNRSQKKDLTSENPFWCLLKFAVPVIIGNLFQLFYTLADSVIVGKTLGTNSLAAVPPVLLFTLCYAKKHCSICCLKYFLLCFADFDLLPAGAPAYNHYENTGRHFQRGL